jgi:hypothetical protein
MLATMLRRPSGVSTVSHFPSATRHTLSRAFTHVRCPRNSCVSDALNPSREPMRFSETRLELPALGFGRFRVPVIEPFLRGLDEIYVGQTMGKLRERLVESRVRDGSPLHQ